MLCQQIADSDPPSSYEATGISYQALREVLSNAMACLPMIDKGNRMVDKCAEFAATLNHCLLLLGKYTPFPFRIVYCNMPAVSDMFFCADQPDGQYKVNGGPEGMPVMDTPTLNQYGVAHSYAPIPIDVSHFDLGALGWDNDGFLSTLGHSLADGFQDADLFC